MHSVFAALACLLWDLKGWCGNKNDNGDFSDDFRSRIFYREKVHPEKMCFFSG
jgi:hypothetical protein